MPTLDALGRDLLAIPRWRIAVSLALPFVLLVGYFLAASTGWWVPAAIAIVALSFLTYGSISHDLVHRSLRLPRRCNDWLLTAIELLMIRSGRAYRLAHGNHHARYPDAADDPEAAAAFGSWRFALAAGPLYFPRLWFWAFRRYPNHRPRLALEATAIAALVIAATVLAIRSISFAPLIYVVLVQAGTWIVPLVTSAIPHDPRGRGPLFQTRRFRGAAIRIIALEHLYHLEHHLYPGVPHHSWPELARRLDPILDAAGVPIVRLAIRPFSCSIVHLRG
ncbi:MAG TPA: fatty acid desaturase [Urbifossiella sp.]|nr:fatty acid desaturase [Urbifossiella sp.]